MAQALPRFIAVGEALTDLIRTGDETWASKVGGSTWNVARAAAAQGIGSAFAGAISRCWFGDALARANEAAGLDRRFLQRVERSPLLAVVVESAPPSYYFIGDDSADLHFDPQLLPAGWRKAAEWTHFGGISLARAPLADRLVDMAAALHAAGNAVSYDPNYRNLMGSAYAPIFERMCRLAQAIKLSDEDLVGLTGTGDPTGMLARVRAWNPQAWWLYTQGAAEAHLFAPAGHWKARPPAVAVADTVGAGDACIAGLLASRMQRPDDDPARHLAHAVAAGAAACQTMGAAPPSREAVRSLLDKVQVERV